MRSVIAVILFLSTAWSTLLAQATQTASSSAPSDEIDRIVASNNAFALDLYAKLATREGNLFFSPSSVHAALVMAYAGASDTTAAQIARALHLPADKPHLNEAFRDLTAQLNNPSKMDGLPTYQLFVSNALWGQKDFAFKSSLLTLVENYYKAGFHQVDFGRPEAAREQINKWVSRRTKGKIENSIPSGVLNSTTRFMLTNSVYFKAEWFLQFDPAATKEGDFTLNQGAKVKVPLMKRREEYGYMENNVVQCLELPYWGGLSMFVLLPRDTVGLGDLEKSLTSDRIAEWIRELRPAEVDITFPRFKCDASFDLVKTLQSMGVTDAFDAYEAVFSNITDERPLYISDVLHQAMVSVDEQGTEAAAASCIGGSGGIVTSIKVFRADHPFVFFIRHNGTGEILFFGRVVDPSAP